MLTVNLLSAAVLTICFVIFSVESDKLISAMLLFGNGAYKAPDPVINGAPINIGTDIAFPVASVPSYTSSTNELIGSSVKLVPPAPTDATLL